MTLGAWMLIVEILVLAALLVTHVALFVRVMGVTGIPTWKRAVALVFPPGLAWKHDKRWHSLLWFSLLAVYLALRAYLRVR